MRRYHSMRTHFFRDDLGEPMCPRFKRLARLTHALALIEAAVASLPNGSWAQTGGVAAAATTRTAAQTLQPGDVYLPSSRVYVFVGKTGFGHEHGVIGQLKQGRIDLTGAREPGTLIFDMAAFTADTPDAR